MTVKSKSKSKPKPKPKPKAPPQAGQCGKLPGQVVLVLQGGGALGAYQVGVYQALHEAGIEPDWVIGTSIGAINGAIIAGNVPGQRMQRLTQFWAHVERKGFGQTALWPGFGAFLPSNFMTMLSGVPGFFAPNPAAALGLKMPIGVEKAAFYSTAALKETLTELIDFHVLSDGGARLTIGAVKVRTGEMRYFDSRDEVLEPQHVMASSALPPAFPAVVVEGDAYWDGGVYSNTPMEAVFDDNPRRDSVVFTVQMWDPIGAEPESIWQVLGRQKDIQYASRASSHIERQEQIHHLRHIIRGLTEILSERQRSTPEVQDCVSYGCGTKMHIIRLLAPHLENEDQLSDIDFSETGIHARWQAGYRDGMRMIDARPWDERINPMLGVKLHDFD